MPIVCQVVAPEAVVVVVGKSNWFLPKIIFNMVKKIHKCCWARWMMTLKIHALLFNSNSNQLLASEIKFFNGVLETLD